MRTGVELPVSALLSLRGGYIYRWLDRDEHVAQTEFIFHSVTGGLSYQPRGAGWAFDSGYLVRWGKANYGDPTRARSNEQYGMFRVRWAF